MPLFEIQASEFCLRFVPMVLKNWYCQVSWILELDSHFCFSLSHTGFIALSHAQPTSLFSKFSGEIHECHLASWLGVWLFFEFSLKVLPDSEVEGNDLQIAFCHCSDR